jgi:hypothetical protein
VEILYFLLGIDSWATIHFECTDCPDAYFLTAICENNFKKVGNLCTLVQLINETKF